MPIFFYPRGLQGPFAERRRFEVPPFFTGPIARSNAVPLATALESRMSPFSMARQLRARAQVRIDLSRDGTRQVITGRRIWQTSVYPSRKCGAAIACEGANELLFAFYCEADPGVLGYATQGVHFQVQVDGRTQNYHADFVRNLANGTVEVVEIKPNASYLEKPGYRAKLDAVKELCSTIGWQFRIYFGEDIRRRTFSNFHLFQMQAHRFLRLPPVIEDAILDRLWSLKDGAEVGDLIGRCGNAVVARAALGALFCRAVLHFDLANRIGPETVVRLVERRAA